MNKMFPKWLQLSFVFMCCTWAYGYDDQLKPLYSAAPIGSEKFTTYVSALKIEDLDLSAITQSAPPENHLLGFKVHHLRM